MKFKLILLLLSSILLQKCANIVPITGGKKDIKEPALSKAYPSNKVTNFKGGKVIMEFDEEIEINSSQENVIVSPAMDKKIEVKQLRKKTIEITIPQNLKENTTYNINLNNYVKDVTEGNTIKNINYVFSTGDKIDSLSVNGRVKDIKLLQAKKNILVGMYEITDTFNVHKHKPTHITFTNAEGTFTINNLKHGEYHLIAIDDKNKNYVLDKKEQTAWWYNLHVDSNITKIELLLSQTDTSRNRISNKQIKNNVQTIEYTKGIKNYTYKTKNTNDSIIVLRSNDANKLNTFVLSENNEVEYYLETYDSIQVKSIDTIIFVKEKKNVKTNNSQLYLDQKELFPGQKKITLSCNKPIKKINTDSIRVNQKDMNIHVTQKSIHEIDIHYTNVKDTLTLKLSKGAVITYDNDSTQSAVFTTVVADQSNYGSLEFKIQTEEPNYIIQLLNDKNKIVEELYNIKTYQNEYMNPGKYKIRVIIDTNNNQIWDIGNIDTNTQPESIKYFNNANEINIKANWEIKDLMFIF
jgi:hypothetical protein